MNQIAPTTTATPRASTVTPSPMVRLAGIVRGLATDLLCASDTRMVKITSDTTGWQVEVEVFAPNPELTVNMRGAAKSILERSRHRMLFDLDLQLTALEPVEE
jgi:hypothetical protein